MSTEVDCDHAQQMLIKVDSQISRTHWPSVKSPHIQDCMKMSYKDSFSVIIINSVVSHDGLETESGETEW